jgi:hypothetical protein
MYLLFFLAGSQATIRAKHSKRFFIRQFVTVTPDWPVQTSYNFRFAINQELLT